MSILDKYMLWAARHPYEALTYELTACMIAGYILGKAL